MFVGSGEPTYLFTNSAHSWNHAYVTVQDRAHFVFAVKACSSVRLLLGENFVSHDVILSSLTLRNHCLLVNKSCYF